MEYLAKIIKIIRNYNAQNTPILLAEEGITLFKKELPQNIKGIILCDDGYKFSVLNNRLSSREELKEVIFHLLYHYSQNSDMNYEHLHTANTSAQHEYEKTADSLIDNYVNYSPLKWRASTGQTG